MQPIAATDHRAPAAAADMLAEIARAHVLGIRGNVTVEVIDDRTGRVVNRLDSKNYVNTAQWEAFAKALQKLAWSYGYQGDSSTVTVRSTDGRDPRQIPTLRNDIVACWTDSTAENTADLYPFGEVIAWAHRWQQGSPSTRQGVVQPTLCTLSDSAVKWVWEWATANGNGTYQSIGWRRLGYVANSGDTALYDLARYDRRNDGTTGFSDAVSASQGNTITITSGSQAVAPIYYDSGSGKLYAVTMATANTWKLCSAAITIDAQGNYNIGAFTDESGAAIAAGLRGNTLSAGTATPMGYTRLGAAGDWIEVGFTSTTTARRPEIRRVTAAGAVTYTNANGGTYAAESMFIDVTYDGTDLWVLAQTAAGVFNIHRVDPATGTISATIAAVAGTPAYWPAAAVSGGPVYRGIEWDADSSWLWVTTSNGYVFNIDTSGNWGEVLISANANLYPLSPATLSGQHNGTRGNTGGILDVDSIRVQFNPDSVTDADDATYPGGQGTEQALVTQPAAGGFLTSRLFTMDGDVWAVTTWLNANSGTPAGVLKFQAVAFTEKEYFATRSLLASPVTKNNTQTMRISYTMTFT